MTAIELTLDDVQQDPAVVHAWLLAHDLEPTETAPGIVVRDGEVTAKVWLRDGHGNRYLENYRGDEQPVDAAHKVIIVPLRIPLPPGLGTVIE